jgi:hypothetical protein
MCGSGNAGYARHLFLLFVFFVLFDVPSPGGDVRAPLRDGRKDPFVRVSFISAPRVRQLHNP